jgi:hypothetical protein
MFKYSLPATQSKAWIEKDKSSQIATGIKCGEELTMV